MERIYVMTAIDYIEKNFANRGITVADVAAAVELSLFHFSREFRAATGKSPHAYLTQVRMRTAQKLLSHGSRTNESIAQACGYATHPHFTNVFARHVGCTPAKYREMARAGAVTA